LLLELGEIDAAVTAVERVGRLNLRLRQPFYTSWELATKATIALMRGALGEAERLILQTLKTQLPLKAPINDPISMLIFSLRREQNRLREFGPAVAAFVGHNAKATIWLPGLAALYVELGDVAAARTLFADLARDNFASLPQDGRWATCLMYLAEVCAALDDAAAAAVLHRLLAPWKGRNIVMGGGTGCWGSGDRFLGLLATVEARWDDAERHFADALALNERTCAFAPLAHTHGDFAAMLLRRALPGDAAKASTHLGEAERRADKLGLTALSARAASLRNRRAPLAPAKPDNLTSRELEVLRLLTIGRGNADIALALRIGHATVATHVHNILTKTGCANRTEAAAYAVRHGLHVD
jgi:ATP/maltotriose-dependent transcriptional regulator MalT